MKNMSEMPLEKLTEKMLGAAYRVSNTLGIGFLEKVYRNAYALELRKEGLLVEQEFPIHVLYDGVVVGDFHADLLVEKPRSGRTQGRFGTDAGTYGASVELPARHWPGDLFAD